MKKIAVFLLFAVLLLYQKTEAQVHIGTDTLNRANCAMLEISSTEKGFLPPRMTDTQMNAIDSLANGLLVYNLDTKSYWFWDGIWRNLSYSGAPGNCGTLYSFTISIPEISNNNHWETTVNIPNFTAESGILVNSATVIDDCDGDIIISAFASTSPGMVIVKFSNNSNHKNDPVIANIKIRIF
ncbi:MAG TPA: hypothetical protein PKZ36_02315 [Candidatus Paceibacterota bacterium]|nr:hypothetical protein [Candidatus Paceibacterota bacterium]HPT18216.1 hypothetical protein [Candidatus Paceibacterota bacterium]